MAPDAHGTPVPGGLAAGIPPASITIHEAPAPPSGHGQVVRAAGVVGVSTLASRILGLARDVACAAVFGGGALWDAFVLAWTIPNLFRRFFGEGALAAAFIPIFIEVRERRGRAAAARFLDVLLTSQALVLTGIVVVGVAVGLLLDRALATDPGLQTLLAASGKADVARMAVHLGVLLFPYVLLVCVLAALGALLNSLGHFFAPAIAPAVLNACWLAALGIGALLASPTEDRILAMVAAILAGGVLQLAIQVPALRRHGVRVRPTLDLHDPDLGRVLRLMGPAILGLAVFQVNVLFDRLVAVGLVRGEGAVSALYFADRFMHFPLALIGIAVSTAVFPVLSRHAALGSHDALGLALAHATRHVLFIAIPATVGLTLLAGPIVDLFFRRGAFDATAAHRTAWVLAIYAFAVWSDSCMHLGTRGFFALKDPRSPVRIAASMVALNLVLDLLLARRFGERGLAFSSSLCSTLQVVVLWALLRRRIGPWVLQGLGRGAAWATVLAVAMGGAVLGTLALLPSGTGSVTRIARVALPLALGMTVYVGLARLARREEAATWLGVLRRKGPPRRQAGATEPPPDVR